MSVKARIGAASDGFNLSFNEIISYTPGSRRGDAKKGMYENRKGDILVVFSKNPAFVNLRELPNGTRANGKKTTRTECTRVGMLLIDKSTGQARPVVCNDKPDGAKNWKVYSGSITLEGNPHVVDADDEEAAEDE